MTGKEVNMRVQSRYFRKLCNKKNTEEKKREYIPFKNNEIILDRKGEPCTNILLRIVDDIKSKNKQNKQNQNENILSEVKKILPQVSSNIDKTVKDIVNKYVAQGEHIDKIASNYITKIDKRSSVYLSLSYEKNIPSDDISEILEAEKQNIINQLISNFKEKTHKSFMKLVLSSIFYQKSNKLSNFTNIVFFKRFKDNLIDKIKIKEKESGHLDTDSFLKLFYEEIEDLQEKTSNFKNPPIKEVINNEYNENITFTKATLTNIGEFLEVEKQSRTKKENKESISEHLDKFINETMKNLFKDMPVPNSSNILIYFLLYVHGLHYKNQLQKVFKKEVFKKNENKNEIG